MIYMVADDPKGGALLDAEANIELDQIIASSLGADCERLRDKLHIAVQIDFRSQPDVWRRVIGEGTWIQPESNAADPATLYGFFEWAARECPAHRNLLMFWGHSAGPFGLFSDGDPWTYVAQTLTLPELRTALEAATDCLKREIDIIAFKDCFMSTLETAYELRDRATYVIASQDIVPIRGWPYSKMFAALADLDDAKEAAKAIVGHLEDHYARRENRGNRKEVPFSLLDTKNVLDLHDPLRRLVSALTTNGKVNGNGSSAATPVPKSVMKVFSGTSPGDPALVDLAALCRKLVDSKRDAVREAALDLQTALRNVVLKPAINGAARTQAYRSRKKARSGGNKGRFGGISVFVNPSGKHRKSSITPLASATAYDQLAVSRTGWNSIALRGLRKRAAEPPEHAKSLYSPNGNGSIGVELLPLLLERLQRHGVLEELQRKGLDIVRQALGGLANGGLNRGNKGQGFDKGNKGQGFDKGNKGQGFAASP